MAFKFGRLLKQNEPDIYNVSLKVLNDWQRGNIPRFTLPPEMPNEEMAIEDPE